MDCAKSSFLTIITAVVLISVTTDLRKLQRHQYGSTVIRNAKNAAEVSIPKLLTIQDAQNLTVYEVLKILGQYQTGDQNPNNYIITSNVYNYLNNKIDTNTVFYNRVPKCGSTTMNELFNLNAVDQASNSKNPKARTKRYEIINSMPVGGRHILETDEEKSDFTKEFLRLAEDRKQQNRKLLFIRHLYFKDFTEHQPIYINLIRNPVDQWISTYYFNRFGFKKKGDADSEQATEKQIKNMMSWGAIESREEFYYDLQTCIAKKTKRCQKVYSEMIPYFCGHELWCHNGNQRAYDKAVENIVKNFAAVGILEDLPSSLRYFEQVTPAGHFANLTKVYEGLQAADKMKNLSEKSKTNHQHTESIEVRDYLASKLQFEIKLYNFVRQLLYTRLKS